VEVVHDCAAAQVEQVFALAAMARTPPLPIPDVCHGVFNGDPLAQFGAPGGGLLACAEVGQEALIGVDADAAPAHTARTAFAEGTGSTDSGREMNRAAWGEGQFDLGRTVDALLRPIERTGRFGEMGTIADGPCFAVDGQRRRSLADPPAAEIAPV